ncbi:pirin family protein [Rhodococcus pyridinivorans]|nr:pirin family protein [Rhodococcus pyridinivorans]
MLSDDLYSAPGFEWHPHRGVETVTFVLDGVLEHGDSLGSAGALTAGDVQRRTAGRGIIHRELAFRNERAHTLQLWVNLPSRKKMTDTRYQDLRVDTRPVVEGDGTRIDIVAGRTGATGQTAWSDPIHGAELSTIDIDTADDDIPARILTFSGPPIGEPVVFGGDRPDCSTSGPWHPDTSRGENSCASFVSIPASRVLLPRRPHWPISPRQHCSESGPT